MILRGLWRLAKGERAGIAEFGSNLDHFYASFGPLIGIPLALALVMAVQGDWQPALVGFLSNLVGVLLLPVLIYEFSRLFKRQDLWMRTATALNWSFLMIFPAFAVAVLVSGVLARCGLAETAAAMLTLALLGAYLLWYRLFALAAGLGLSLWQAGLVMLVSSVGVGIVTLAPIAFGLGPNLALPPT
jgi:hypothetical protein